MLKPDSCNTVLILLINILILGYSLFLNKKLYKSYCYISLPFLASMFFVFYFIIVHTYIIFSNNQDKYYSFNHNPEYIVYAAIFATLCNLCFQIGATIRFCTSSRLNIGVGAYRLLRTFSEKSLFKVAVSLFAIGVMFKIIYYLYLGGGNINYYFFHYYAIQLEDASDGAGFQIYLKFLDALLTIGNDLILIHYLKYKKYNSFTILAFLTTVVLNFNHRGKIIQLIVQAIVLICIFRKPIRKKIHIIFLATILPIIFGIIIGVGIFRESTNNKVLQNVDYTYFFLGANHGMKALSDCLEYKISFEERHWGKAIILPLIQKPIPRKIWKDKYRGIGAIYTSKMYPGSLEAGGAIAPGVCADAYINFGYFGGLLFFGLIGWLITAINRFILNGIRDERTNILCSLFLAISASILLMLRGEEFHLLIMMIIYYLPALLLVFMRFKVKFS